MTFGPTCLVAEISDLGLDDLYQKPRETLLDLWNEIKSDGFTAISCAEDLRHANTLLRKFSLQKMDLTQLDGYQDKIWHSQLIAPLRLARSSLANRIKEFDQNQNLSKACGAEALEFFHLARYDDNLLNHQAEWRWFKHSRHKYHALEGALQKIHPENRMFRSIDDLKSGDILVGRGAGPFSTTISAVGTSDSDFSHLGIIYRGGQTNEIFAIDAKSRNNIQITPIKDFLAGDYVRMAIYRHHDPEIAARAAQYIYDFQTENERNHIVIEYDLLTQSLSEGRTNCSLLIKSAYDIIAPGHGIQSEYFSRLELQNPTIATRIGKNHMDLFFPGDMEIQPNFSLIAEWYDPFRIWETQLYDVGASTLMSWVDQGNYEVKGSGRASLARSVYIKAQSGDKIARHLLDKAHGPQSMSPDLATLIVDFAVSLECLSKKLMSYETAIRKLNGDRPLSFQERVDYLESLRERSEVTNTRLCSNLYRKPDSNKVLISQQEDI